MPYSRFTQHPDQMGGVPCIRGLRIPVATVLAMLDDRMSEDEILEAYPDLEREDIHEARRFATEAAIGIDADLKHGGRSKMLGGR